MTIPDTDPRLGPRVKLERAKEHIAALDAEIQAFIDSEPYVFRINRDPDRTEHIVLESSKPHPLKWSAMIGDIIHNSRSALDLLASAVRYQETKVFEKVGFPIFRHKADFDAKAFNNWGHGCPRAIRFFKRLKPYYRGGDPGHHANTLVLLHNLWNRDKHRLIIPVGTAIARVRITPKPGFGEPFWLAEASEARFLTDGEELMCISPFDPLLAGKDFETSLTTQIRLSGVKDLPAVGASSMLHHIIKVVDRIVKIAERRVF